MTAIPHAAEPFLDAAGRVTRVWRTYLSTLPQDEASAALQQQIDQLWDLVNADDGGDGLPLTTSLQVNGSIEVIGTLASGVVILSLSGDADAPGSSYYYGTDASGNKGFFPFQLAALADVDLTGLAAGDTLAWDAIAEKWIVATVSQTFNRITADGDIRVTIGGDLRII